MWLCTFSSFKLRKSQEKGRQGERHVADTGYGSYIGGEKREGICRQIT